MREDNLLCLRRVKRVRTTDSRHGLTVYPNLVPELDLTGLNQLWVADITYVRLLREFVYLAVLLDAYARRDKLVHLIGKGEAPLRRWWGSKVRSAAPTARP